MTRARGIPAAWVVVAAGVATALHLGKRPPAVSLGCCLAGAVLAGRIRGRLERPAP